MTLRGREAPSPMSEVTILQGQLPLPKAARKPNEVNPKRIAARSTDGGEKKDNALILVLR